MLLVKKTYFIHEVGLNLAVFQNLPLRIHVRCNRRYPLAHCDPKSLPPFVTDFLPRHATGGGRRGRRSDQHVAQGDISPGLRAGKRPGDPHLAGCRRGAPAELFRVYGRTNSGCSGKILDACRGTVYSISSSAGAIIVVSRRPAPTSLSGVALS